MLKFKRETSGTSAIIWLITEHAVTDYSTFFSWNEQSDNGTGARRSNGGPNKILAVRTDRTDGFRELCTLQPILMFCFFSLCSL